MMRAYKAVFLDRDDTLNRDVRYCSQVKDFELLPTVGAGVRRLNDEDFKVVVITNQSGIARGYFTEETLGQIHQKMAAELAGFGAHVDAIYYCPHHPEQNCACRKPKPKLAWQAMREHDIDPQRSFVIGDRLMDIGLARAIGSSAVMVPSELGRRELGEAGVAADYVAVDFAAAVQWVIQQSHRER